MNDKMYESIASSLACLLGQVLEHQLSPLEEEIFYDKVMTIKLMMEAERESK